jgi:hypothetical protein
LQVYFDPDEKEHSMRLLPTLPDQPIFEADKQGDIAAR